MRRLLHRLRALGVRRQFDAQLAEEVEVHLAMQTAENIRAGMSPAEARRQAVLKFGSVEAVKEEYRATRGLAVFETLVRDARYAFRQLRGSPAFALTATLTLALGIGANTAIFSIVNAVMLRPLPFAHPSRLLSVQSLNMQHVPRPDELSYPDFFDFRAYNHVFDHLVSFRGDEFNLKTSSAPLHLDGEIVSWDLFPALGVSPVYGRGFLPEEEKPGMNVAVLSYSLWRSQFGGDRGLVGRSITINGEGFTVVGIAPKGFHFPVEYPDVQIWTTLAQDATGSPGVHPMTIQRGGHMIDAIGRLKPGVTLDQARAQMDTIAADLARQYPDSNKNVARTSIKPELEELLGFSRAPLLILMGAVGMLLLIACLNIANLLLSRTAERAREFALRAAIGASRGVILRQLLTESLLLAFLGSAAGVLLAFASIPVLVRLAGAATIPRVEDTQIDSTVLIFAIVLAVVSAVLFSLAPLVQIARIELVEFVKEGTHSIAAGRDRLRSALIVAQLGLGLVLLCGASLLATAFVNIETLNPGFRLDHLLRFGVALPSAQYPIPKQIVFNDRLMERLSVIPGVESVTSGWPLPFEGDQAKVSFGIQEHPAPMPERPHADIAVVTPGFFHTLGIPLIRGRVFTKYDDFNAPHVVIVNQAFANQFFPGENAIGKRIQSGATYNRGPVIQTIIGIVGNARQSALKPTVDPIYYFPYKQLSWGFGWIILRTSIPPRTVESAARAAVKTLDPQVPITNPGTMEDAFYAAVNPARFLTWLLGTFAGIALLLAMVGVYGVMTYSVSRRTREMGVRIAVGADRSTIVGMIFKKVAVLLGIGIALGAAAAMFADRLLERIPFMIHVNTWLLLSIGSFAMALTGAVATYIPATRAASVDPVKALRVE